MRGISQQPAVNFIGFQVYWWTCILFQEQGVVLCVLLLAAHLYFHSSRQQELQSLVILGTFGFVIDALLTRFGVFYFPETNNFAPLWLLVLWIGFASNVTTLTANFKLTNTWYLCIGAMFAPFSYVAASYLGVVSFPLPLATTWLVLVAVWALLLPTLVMLQKQLRIKERVLA